MEATLLILLSLLLLSLTVWNIAVHRRLSRARTQDAANRAQLDATLQALARRLSDAEDLLGTMSHPEAGDVEPEHTEAEMTAAEPQRAGGGHSLRGKPTPRGSRVACQAVSLSAAA